jgi:hypothetical protein
MEAEMKALRYSFKDRYLDRVIMTRVLQIGMERQQAIDGTGVEATLRSRSLSADPRDTQAPFSGVGRQTVGAMIEATKRRA